jgi:hypothetical protein
MGETKGTTIRLNKEDRKNIKEVQKQMRRENFPEHLVTQSEAIRFALKNEASRGQ